MLLFAPSRYSDMAPEEVSNCAFHNWYSQFENTSVRSKIVNISDDALQYIVSNGLILPSDISANNRSDDLDKFFSDIKSAIKSLGGSVIPKFTWSVPIDAKWISHDKSLKCQTPDEVMMLIKSSDFVTHDIEHAFDDCNESESPSCKQTLCHKLNLREWVDIIPSSEFRCFVKNNALVGISQRHCDTFFPDLTTKVDFIKEKITNFFLAKIQFKFSNVNFIFDVFLDKQEVKLLDFNAFNSSTESLLFTWEEIKNDSLKGGTLEFRLVESKGCINSNPHQWHSYPMDFLHLSAGLDYNKFIDLLQSKDLIRSFDSDSDSDADDCC